MVLAPGFETIAGIPAGLILKGRMETKRAVISVVKGFSTVIVAAALTAAAFAVFSEGIKGTYLPEGSLFKYWTTISIGSKITAFIAGVAGVMVVLALIPAASLIGIGAVRGDWSVVETSLIRLVLELFLVICGTGVIFWLKKKKFYKRASIRISS